MFSAVSRRRFSGIGLKSAEKALFVDIAMFNHQLLYGNGCLNELITEVLQTEMVEKLNRRNLIELLKQVTESGFAIAGKADIVIQRKVPVPGVFHFLINQIK